jgi:hypothetical protein
MMMNLIDWLMQRIVLDFLTLWPYGFWLTKMPRARSLRCVNYEYCSSFANYPFLRRLVCRMPNLNSKHENPKFPDFSRVLKGCESWAWGQYQTREIRSTRLRVLPPNSRLRISRASSTRGRRSDLDLEVQQRSSRSRCQTCGDARVGTNMGKGLKGLLQCLGWVQLGHHFTFCWSIFGVCCLLIPRDWREVKQLFH